MDERILGTDCRCGGGAGTDKAGREHFYCNGYKGPLDTYVCLCGCHTGEAHR